VLPFRTLDDAQVASIVNGAAVAVEDPPEGHLLLVDADGAAVAVAEVKDGRAKPRVGFRT